MLWTFLLYISYIICPLSALAAVLRLNEEAKYRGSIKQLRESYNGITRTWDTRTPLIAFLVTLCYILAYFTT